MLKLINKIKKLSSNAYYKSLALFTIFMFGNFASAQNNKSPFDTQQLFGEEMEGKGMVHQMKWTITTFFQIIVVVAITGLAVASIYGLVSALKNAAKSGEWGDYMQQIIMSIIGIILAVVFATMAWNWVTAVEV